MIELVLAKQVLADIIENDISFKKALRKAFSANKSSDVSKTISALVGCELRHHFMFEESIKRLSIEVSNDEKYLIYLAACNKFFLKRLDVKKVGEYLGSVFEKEKLDYLSKAINTSGTFADAVPVKKDSIDYVGLRFNTPKWLIKMWSKHYGRGTSFKILKKNSKPIEQTYRINEMLDSMKNFDGEIEDFKVTKVPGVYSYVGTKPIKSNPLIENNELVAERPIYKEIVDKYQNELIQEASVFSGMDDSLFKELLIRSQGRLGINVVVPNLGERAEILRQIRLSGYKTVNLFEAKDEIGFKTGISHKQDIFYVHPKSSSFDKIRVYPDYLIHFKQHDIDTFIKEQKSSLETSSKFVNDGGLLIYVVDTLNLKETTAIIDDFLVNHEEFELVEDRQIFPFDEEDITLYYAVMKLKEASND